MQNSIKLLSFIIAIKRYKRNSTLLNKARYKLAQHFQISPSTFIKYLNQCEELGWIKKSGGNYTAIPLEKILTDFNSQTNLFFAKHKVVKKGQNFAFNEVLKEIEQILLIDNVIVPQQHVKDKKETFINDYKTLTAPTGTKMIRRITDSQYKMVKSGMRCAGIEVSKMKFTSDIVSSARHTSAKLGISLAKANKILNYGGKVERTIQVRWYHGISFVKLELLRLQYPNASVIPFVNYNKIKVCLGSSLNLV
jgi:hypothetical protein